MKTQPDESATLRRVLGVWSLTLYGLGTIIGAGIYVLVGAVAGQAGMGAPLSFLLAGGLAAFTGLSYAELGQRYPEAAGEAAYAREAFGSERLGQIVGFATIAIAMVACASIARGSVGYVQVLIALPDPLITVIIISAFTALAAYGVRESVYLAATLTVVEVGGLIFVIFVGWDAMGDLPQRWRELAPVEIGNWGGLMGGAFLAFFAFAGFENMVNMAEETKDVEYTLPIALMAAIVVSTLLYMLVILVLVLNVEPQLLAASDAPLCRVVDCDRPSGAVFIGVALLATLNGVLIEIVLMARVTYGMARRGWLPDFLAHVHTGRRTPMKATILMGTVAVVLATTFSFEALARATSTLLLCVFLLVNLALLVLKQKQPDVRLRFRIPVWVPLVGAASSLGLLVTEMAP